MTRILRSPTIAHQTRQLRHPRAVPVAETPAFAASPAAPADNEHGIEIRPDFSADLQALECQLAERIRAELLEQIRADAEAARELGRQRGLREGRDAGQEETRQALAAEMDRLRGIVDMLAQAVDSGIRNQEALTIAIAYEAVCRILGDTLITPEGVAAQVRAVAERVTGGERLVVRLHPDDLALLQSAGLAAATLDNHVSVSWVADTQTVLGGCILETDGNGIDARLETQMERLRTCLLDARQINATNGNTQHRDAP